MRKKHLVFIAAVVPSLATAQPAERVTALRDAALRDDLAWEIAEGLTTEIGPRLAGSAQEARARAWAIDRLRALGFHDPRIEPFGMTLWTRGEARAEVVAPYPQSLSLAALGASAATPAEGITAQVVRFETLDALRAADPALLAGRIAFVDHRMGVTQDGSSYGAFNAIRTAGPRIASAKGAVAIVIRSIGTDRHRLPHAGQTTWNDARPIPAAALSNPDADQLNRIFARNAVVSLHLLLRTESRPAQSGNVMAEVPGRDPKLPIVVVGCHLDSWDLGTGAIDDAAGCGIVTAAAKRIMDAPGRPLRTIRVVWFGSEEIGIVGGVAYRDAHRTEPHQVVAESDFGADRIWRFATDFAPAGAPVAEQLRAALLPLGIAANTARATGASDVAPIAKTGVPAIDLSQDGRRYFDLHHTADDTLDKIDREQLRQNVAAWTAMLAIVSETPIALGPVPPRPAN